jgi:hypothetical protein
MSVPDLKIAAIVSGSVSAAAAFGTFAFVALRQKRRASTAV